VCFDHFTTQFHAGPANYDFTGTRAIAMYEDTIAPSAVPATAMEVLEADTENKDPEADISSEAKGTSGLHSPSSDKGSTTVYVVDREVLQATFKRAMLYSFILTMIVVVIGMSISLILHYLRAFLSNHSIR
jgi:hypothetical protein